MITVRQNSREKKERPGIRQKPVRPAADRNRRHPGRREV